MDAIHSVRVLLFWVSEIARDAYGPYFTGVVPKSWTLPTNRMISHAELIQRRTVPITHDRNTINMMEYVTTIRKMVSDEPSMLYSTINDDEMKLTIQTKIVSYLVNLNQTITMTQRKKSYKLL
ncbi:hypothetical protein M9H77_07475 [Catharanthus roseus]|uniref:Uncharacterized protein n=1 Tax=Catharanthus roseus TaxID=4058 RepID=A0ACC0BV29_CATRO|nr:hypothetical protein M9H77_07475 [Catharanthus roseus]